MNGFFKELLKPLALLKDARFLYLFVPATIILIMDWPGYEALIKTFCVFFMLLGFAHFFRKLIVGRIDMSAVAARATDHPVGAAIVFFALVLFYMFLTLAPIWWVKP